MKTLTTAFLFLVATLATAGAAHALPACNVLGGDLFPCNPRTGQCSNGISYGPAIVANGDPIPMSTQACWECYNSSPYVWDQTPPGQGIRAQCPNGRGCTPAAPGFGCEYACAGPNLQCEMPATVVVGALSQAAKDALMRHQIDVQNMLARWKGHLNILGESSPQYRAWLKLIVNVMTGAALVGKAFEDPANPDYDGFPAGPALTLNTPTTVVPGGFTAAQAAALDAWAAKMQKHAHNLGQYTQTYDNLSGAVAANDGAWVRRLAGAGEDALSRAGKFGKKAANARAGLLAAFPSQTFPAYCITSADLDLFASALSTAGVPGDVTRKAITMMTGVCAPAGAFPADFAGLGPDEFTTWSDLMHGGSEVRDNICDATTFCASTTSIALSPRAPTAGAIKVDITVTADGPYEVQDGDVVTALISGGIGTKDVVLTGGVGFLKVVGVPHGTYTVTVTYPELRDATMGASVATLPVSVP